MSSNHSSFHNQQLRTMRVVRRLGGRAAKDPKCTNSCCAFLSRYTTTWLILSALVNENCAIAPSNGSRMSAGSRLAYNVIKPSFAATVRF